MNKKLCKNCNHEIYKDVVGKWKHKKYTIQIMRKKYLAICDVRIYGNKFKDFEKRYFKKFKKKYVGKNPICGCDKPEEK